MNNVAIVVVTYNPIIEDLIQNIDSYYSQTNLIVLIDNSTNTQIQKKLYNILKEKYKKIKLIQLLDNYGIAYAQNIGIKEVIFQQYKYFIEIDQDSKLPDEYVNNIYATYIEISKKNNKIAGIGPLAVNKDTNDLYHNHNVLDTIIEVDKTLSSGFFIPIVSLELIGFKDESLFIDLVDWEWCWRANSKGYKVYIDTSLRINHLLGDGHKSFYFFKIGIPSPIRHYYQYRNAIELSKRDYIPFQFKLKRFFIHFIKPIFYIIFYDSKIIRLSYIYRGIKDGILNRTGKIHE